MKIIEATWEKQNLGVECKEVVFDLSDSLLELKNIEKLLLSTEYAVVKIPINRFDANTYLNQLGFSFIEGSINFQLKLSEARLLPLQERLNKAVSYSTMDALDLELLYREIKGGMFTTDRILLDNAFTNNQASQRYCNWIAEEVKRQTQVFKIVYKTDTIGFFTFKSISDGVFYPFLAGLYKKFENSGMGFATLRKPIDEAIKRGGAMISTYASTNNLPVIRAHTQQGFQINGIQYVFVKHNK